MLRYDAAELLEKLHERKLLAKFNSYSSFIIPASRMLKMTAQKKINAQDSVIAANMLLAGGGCIFPPRSCSNHIGFGDGVHCTVETSDYISELADGPIRVTGEDVEEDPRMVRCYHNWLLRVHLKLLVKYLIAFGPIRNYFRAKYKNREF